MLGSLVNYVVDHESGTEPLAEARFSYLAILRRLVLPENQKLVTPCHQQTPNENIGRQGVSSISASIRRTSQPALWSVRLHGVLLTYWFSVLS